MLVLLFNVELKTTTVRGEEKMRVICSKSMLRAFTAAFTVGSKVTCLSVVAVEPSWGRTLRVESNLSATTTGGYDTLMSISIKVKNKYAKIRGIDIGTVPF